MEPASNETEKQADGDDNTEAEEPLDDGEFQKCSRKGRRDACPDIHCKCSDSEQSGECLFHKDTVETDSNGSKEQKTWYWLYAQIACLNAFKIWQMLFIFGSSGTNLVFERDIYFGETHLRVSNPQGGNLEIAMVSIANSVNFPENRTKEQFKLSAINFVRSNYRKKSNFLHLFSSLFRSRWWLSQDVPISIFMVWLSNASRHIL